MKTTTRLYDICYGILETHRVNIYTDNNQIVWEQNNLMNKVLNYEDPKFKELLETYLFPMTSQINQRERFEREFLQRFLTRVIKYQTVDSFKLYLSTFISSNIELINYIYDEYDAFAMAQSDTTSNANSSSINKSNSIFSNLPQNEVNMNLDIDTMSYADNNTINKSKSTGSDTSHSSSKSYNVDTLNKLKQLKESIFIAMDKYLFSQLF